MDTSDFTDRPVRFLWAHIFRPQLRSDSSERERNRFTLGIDGTVGFQRPHHGHVCSRSQPMSKHVSQTQQRLPNMQSNSSEVIGVSVDFGQERVWYRTSWDEPAREWDRIARKCRRSLKKLHIQYPIVLNHS